MIRVWEAIIFAASECLQAIDLVATGFERLLQTDPSQDRLDF